MIEQIAMDYGALGLFVAYLIYDKQMITKKIIATLEELTKRIETCPK